MSATIENNPGERNQGLETSRADAESLGVLETNFGWFNGVVKKLKSRVF
jgi:hypothetical protein